MPQARTKAPKPSTGGREGFASVDEVMAFTGKRRTAVYRMLEAGELPSIKIGGSRRVPWKALLALEQQAMDMATT